MNNFRHVNVKIMPNITENNYFFVIIFTFFINAEWTTSFYMYFINIGTKIICDKNEKISKLIKMIIK